jgi:hypothetical protein
MTTEKDMAIVFTDLTLMLVSAARWWGAECATPEHAPKDYFEPKATEKDFHLWRCSSVPHQEENTS